MQNDTGGFRDGSALDSHMPPCGDTGFPVTCKAMQRRDKESGPGPATHERCNLGQGTQNGAQQMEGARPR